MKRNIQNNIDVSLKKLNTETENSVVKEDTTKIDKNMCKICK